MVHGLATLILEGSLARKLKIPKTRQRQVANDVIGTFMRLIGKNSRSSLGGCMLFYLSTIVAHATGRLVWPPALCTLHAENG